MNLLICGHGSDSVCTSLRHKWCAHHDEIRFLDLDWIDRSYRFDIRSLGQADVGSIEGPDWQVSLYDISVVFLRYLGVNQAIRKGPRPVSAKASLESAYSFWMELLEGLECPIVNRLSASSSNHSKPYQLQQMKAIGFLVPETLVTNDVALAEAFCAQQAGPVVFKSVSGARARTQVLNRRNHRRLRLLPNCPTQFQPLISGCDARVHVIGNQCFGLRIESSEVDYRYQQKDLVRIETCAVPTPIQNQCRQITHVFGLHLSGIDFRVTDQGEWYGLEVNPAPAFTNYELPTGQPLTAAVLDLLYQLSSGVTPAF